MRLDLFILQKFNLKSRSFAENLIKKGKVNVNNVTLKSRRTTFRTTTKSKFFKTTSLKVLAEINFKRR